MLVEATQRIARLMPLDAVLERIDALVAPVAAREVAIADAVGRVVAADVTVTSRPAVALALRDGWAVNSALAQDAGPYAPAPLPSALWIEAGAPLPPGADAVAEIDAVMVRDGRAQAIAPIASGEGVLAAGADADHASPFRLEGRRLRAVAAAALAGAGIARIRIREPRLAVVRARPAGDPVIDAAAALVAHAIAAAGGVVLDHLAGGEGLEGALRRQDADDADAVVAIGGTGNGRNDGSVMTLARLGRVEAHGIAISPGETAAFGMVEARPVLLLPGRLDGALAAWLLLGRRMLARLCGEPRGTARDSGPAHPQDRL